MPKKKQTRVKGMDIRDFAKLYVQSLDPKAGYPVLIRKMMELGEYKDEAGAKRALYSFKKALEKKAKEEGKNLSLPDLPNTPTAKKGTASIEWGDLTAHVPSLAKYLAPAVKQAPSLAK